MPTDEDAVRRIVENLLSDSGFRARFNVGGFSAADKDTLVTTAEQVAQLMGDKSIQASIGNALWLDGASIINGTITAPKIEVTTLSAIVVNTGALTVSDTVTIGAGGKITDADGSYWDQTGIVLYGAGTEADALRWVDSNTEVGAGFVTASADGLWASYWDGADTWYALTLTETYGLLGICSPNFNTAGAGFIKLDNDGTVTIGQASASHIFGADNSFQLPDGITAPSATSGWAKLYVDSADGDLKIKFGDGTTKTIATDT